MPGWGRWPLDLSGKSVKKTDVMPVKLFARTQKVVVIGCCLVCCTAPWVFAASTGLKVLPGHVPKLPPGLTSTGEFPATNQLRLAIGLPLRDPGGLQQFLAQLYDPASTNYHHYLSPTEFTERFGPTAADYQMVKDFARTNGLSVTDTHTNRLLLDVEGSVGDIERAFHIKLLKYHHPTENRDFYAPDREPSVNAQLPISDVSGLDNYTRPQPLVKIRPEAISNVSSDTGSGPSGTFLGKDFRAAYLPGVTLTGGGQMVGLLQFDGFYANDISSYASAAGITAVPTQIVLLDGYNGTPTSSGNIEVSLDIEMAMSMAPGLTKIILFEGGPNGIPNDILNAMAASNQVKQLSCSWGWTGGPQTTTDNIFKQMAAQGQSFFCASGDSDAFTTGASSVNGVDNPSVANAPSSSPYITTVGGTTLTTTGPGGAWSSETAWNWGLDGGSYVGSSGGISSYYNTLPTWQNGVANSSNGGSSGNRNIPDVALTGDNVYVKYGSGSSGTVGGTSCASPLWAALTALINQQAVAAGHTNVGFLNPALYALGKSAASTTAFHDITTGNNFWKSSPSLFSAVSGYDLCTGWGTPAGQSLINALANTGSAVTNSLAVSPAAGFTAAGPAGGPFSPASQSLTLSNSGVASLTWSLINTSSWLNLSSASGALAAHGAISVTAALASTASNLPPGIYRTTVTATNANGADYETFVLIVGASIAQNGGFETGDFTGWTLSGNTANGSTTYNAVESSSSGYSVVHSGNYGAFLGDTQLASLTQSVPTMPGQYYLLSLWVDNPISGTVQQFKVNWNTNSSVTNTLFSLFNPSTFSWTNLQFLVRATQTNTTLQIQAENDPGYFGLDDVAVTPIPSPAFSAAGFSNGVFRLSWISTTGLLYQVQYRTDLVQGSWINLSAPFAATSYNTTVTDPSTFGTVPRYYRLVVTP